MQRIGFVLLHQTSSCDFFLGWLCTSNVHKQLLLISIRVHCLPHSSPATTFFLSYPDFEPMNPNSKQSKRRGDVLSFLNTAIEGLSLAKNLSSITPANAVFSTVSVVLTMIRVSFLLLREGPL